MKWHDCGNSRKSGHFEVAILGKSDDFWMQWFQEINCSTYIYKTVHRNFTNERVIIIIIICVGFTTVDTTKVIQQ